MFKELRLWFRDIFKKETSLLWKLAWASILFGTCVIGFTIGSLLYWFVKGLFT